MSKQSKPTATKVEMQNGTMKSTKVDSGKQGPAKAKVLKLAT
jgi:hypothetical protein